MKVNNKLLPIKLHYFLFMAASGAVLPFLQVMGKQLGVSEVVMGSITALLPPLFLLAKPLFGILVDHFSTHRRIIFLFVLAGQNIAYGCLYFIPQVQQVQAHQQLPGSSHSGNLSLYTTNLTTTNNASPLCEDLHHCPMAVTSATVSSVQSLTESWTTVEEEKNSSYPYRTAKIMDPVESNLYVKPEFWIFVALLSIGTVFFNVANSVSDAITFDILGEGQEMSYGTQRVWGTIGFGVAALIAGSAMEYWSASETIDKNFTPALALAITFGIIDLVICHFHLQMPLMPRSNRILHDVGLLVRHKKVAVFLVFAAVCGVLDGFIIYYLFWYLEDLAVLTNKQASVKILEGLVVAAETLCGETVFFYLSGAILKRLGNKNGDHSYARGLTLSLFSFALRFALISFAPNPWFMLPVEAVMQGPTYALSYTAIVGYAAVVSPPGASTTMQGLVAGVDDGLGYAIGSLIGGILYKYFGGTKSFQIFAGIAALSGVLHHVLYESYLKHKSSEATYQVKYNLPKAAAEVTVSAEADMSTEDRDFRGVKAA